MATKNKDINDSAERVVDAQLAAYNRRDIESFVSFYGDDIVVRRKGQTVPLMTGKNELKLRYQELFKISPDLHVEVSNRRIKDGYIIDREDVVGLRGEPGHRYFIVKTRVTKGLIVEVIIEPE